MHGLMSHRRFGRARSLRSDRTLVRAWSLRSDRAEWTFGRYVATELWLELGRYVATERSTCYELCPQRLAEIGSDFDASFRRCFVETDRDHRLASWFAFFLQGRDVTRLPVELAES
ncbi:hypothetical protein F2Q70_00035627 [Brassica cretica]|uniref:Uncharacterized protein n=1 Tax=Brassica cretica TaxID=69181 RepID=A0A8S9JT44_BRACR|nr:hypothetical protein F2Q70_00035627 [Brassica cretica]